MENKLTHNYVNLLKQISINNKYFKWYISLCLKGQARANTRHTAKELLGVVEQHHILPKSLQGDNEADNLVFLSLREHFIAHLLLVKFLSGQNKHKMCYALHRLITDKKHTSRSYAFLKSDFQDAFKESGKRIWKTRKRGPQNFSSEIKQRMSDAQKKKCIDHPRTDKWRENQRQFMLLSNPFRGKKHTEISRKKMSNAVRPTVYCTTCNMNISKTNFTRFHQHKHARFTDGVTTYSSISEMARAHNVSPATMTYRVKSQHVNMHTYTRL